MVLGISWHKMICSLWAWWWSCQRGMCQNKDYCWKSFYVFVLKISSGVVSLQNFLRAITLIKYLIFAPPPFCFQHSLTILFEGNTQLRLAFKHSDQIPWQVWFPSFTSHFDIFLLSICCTAVSCVCQVLVHCVTFLLPESNMD